MRRMAALAAVWVFAVLPADAGARGGLGLFALRSPAAPAAHGSGPGGAARGWPPAFAAPGLQGAMMGLRGARGRAAAVCMQGDGGKGQPKKAEKKPRKRSNRKSNPFEMPEPVQKPGGGPLGKAKRRMLERIEEMEEKQVAEWATLKGRLQSERVEGVWAANDPALAEKRKRWNLDLTSRDDQLEQQYDLDEDENAVDVMGTNDPDWKQVRDVSTGDIYFWNLKTDETSWDVPEGIKVQEKLSPFRGVTKTIADPGGAAGVKWLCTQTTSGHAHYGIFFEVKAKSDDVYITGVRTASHYRSNIYEANYRVLMREGSCYGFENSKQGWRQVGIKRVKAKVRRWGPKKWDKYGLTRYHKTAIDSMSG